MKKTAFTLAEVLIALVIIGVIAAITVPIVMQNTQKQEYVSKLQKTYSVLSQATNQIIAEEGSPSGDEGWADTVDNTYNLYKKHLNNAKECETERGCFASSYKTYAGIDAQFTNIDNDATFRRLVLSDGTSVSFRKANNIMSIYVDINGIKSPNKTGRDFFEFVIEGNELTPKGCGSDNCLNKNIANSGHYCTCKVLIEGKMDY